MNKCKYLVMESLKKKIKSKWFIGINIFVFVLLLIIMNISTIVDLFGGDYKETKEIIVVDNLNIYPDFEKYFENVKKYSVNDYILTKSTESIDTLKKQVKVDSNKILIVITEDEENIFKIDLITNNGINNINRNYIVSGLGNIKYKLSLEKSGITQEQLQSFHSNFPINEEILINTNVKENDDKKAGETSNNNDYLGVVAVIIFTMPFLFLISTLVQMIGAEINEEKSTKSMEIIISNVPPKAHLISKIISCTIFNILQLLLLASFFGIAMYVKNKLGTNIETDSATILNDVVKAMFTKTILNSLIKILPILVVFLIFTLFTYSILAGVLASVTTNIDDFQQLQTPIMLIISVGFYLSLIASIFEGSKFIAVMSYIPLISFMLSPSLYMLNQVSLVSLIISLIIQIIFTFVVYKYGLRVYKEGILNYSSEHLWRKLFSSLKKDKKDKS